VAVTVEFPGRTCTGTVDESRTKRGWVTSSALSSGIVAREVVVVIARLLLSPKLKYGVFIDYPGAIIIMIESGWF